MIFTANELKSVDTSTLFYFVNLGEMENCLG